MPLAGRLHRLIHAEVDARPVALARIVIGVAVLLKLAGGVRILGRLVEPTTIKVPMVAGLPAPTPAMVTTLLGLWAVAGVCFLAGWRTRTAGSVLTLVLAVMLVLDQQTYSNHVYLLALVVGLLTAADAGAAWSLDARRGPRASVPAWPVFLLQAQTSLVYTFAALSKLTPDYLSGLALAPFVQLQAGVALIGLPAMATIVLLLSWAAIPAELVVAACLWSPRRRVGAALLGVVLHLGMVAAIYRMRFDLAVFAVMMWGLYFLFVGPDVLRSLERRMAHAVKPKPAPTDANPQATG
jgi:hypothetical protein